MIARHRGDEMREHSRWRPAILASPTVLSTEPAPPPDELAGELADDAPDLAQSPSRTFRRSRALIAIAALVIAAALASRQHTGSAPAAIGLPTTPRAWIQAWTAASLDNPERVCGTLFSPALVAAFRSSTGHSCSSYYNLVKSTSFRIEHVLQDGPTAAVEAHQVSAPRKWGYFTVLLSHVRGGWQAIDIVPGGPVRSR